MNIAEVFYGGTLVEGVYYGATRIWAPAAGGPLVFDGFNRPDESPPAGWSAFGVPWGVAGNQLAVPATGGTNPALHSMSLGTPDHWVQAVFSVNMSDSQGIIARSNIGAGSYYLWRADGSTWTLFVNLSGSFTSLGSVAQGRANGDVARLECQGTTIRGYRNGNLLVEAESSSGLTGTYVGVRAASSSTARYDDFSADVL